MKSAKRFYRLSMNGARPLSEIYFGMFSPSVPVIFHFFLSVSFHLPFLSAFFTFARSAPPPQSIYRGWGRGPGRKLKNLYLGVHLHVISLHHYPCRLLNNSQLQNVSESIFLSPFPLLHRLNIILSGANQPMYLLARLKNQGILSSKNRPRYDL